MKQLKVEPSTNFDPFTLIIKLSFKQPILHNATWETTLHNRRNMYKIGA